MKIHAFPGLRYTGAAGEPSDLAAPPFDQIDDRLRDRLHGTANHFTHLTKSVPRGGRSAAESAAELHARWLAEGRIAHDDGPSVYPYEIELADGGKRLGLCALIGIAPPGSDVVRPHEHTITKTVAERLHLLQATRVDLEPIMLLADDGGRLDTQIEGHLDEATLLVSHTDPAGDRHSLYRQDDPAGIARYREILGPLPALIADGHHRYRVSQLHAEQSGAEPGTAAAAKLAVIISLASPTLVIDPIHRGVAEPIDLDGMGRYLNSAVRWEGTDGDALARAVAEAPQPALGVWRSGSSPEIWHLDPAHRPHNFPPAAGELSVVLLHGTLFAAGGLTEGNWTDGTVTYRSNPESLFREVQRGDLAEGFWLPPMTGDAFAAAIAHGDLLPPKSTRFMPKLISGMVWSSHDAEID